jgi:hypothetical protein
MSIININVLHTFELGPILAKFLEANVADFQSLKRAIDDLRSEVDAEKVQGTDLEKRLTDLEARTAGGLTAAESDELLADLDALKGAIGGIVYGCRPDPRPAGRGADAVSEPAPRRAAGRRGPRPDPATTGSPRGSPRINYCSIPEAPTVASRPVLSGSGWPSSPSWIAWTGAGS